MTTTHGAGTPAVATRESRVRISMRPTGPRHRTGLIFYPGALVDPRAYVPNLTASAAAGYPVVVVDLLNRVDTER